MMDLYTAEDGALPASPTERAPSIAIVTAACALLGAVLQMCAEGDGDEQDEPVVEFRKLVDLGTRVSNRVTEMQRQAKVEDDEDDEDAGGEDAGLSVIAMRGDSMSDPVKTDLRALLVVLAAYIGYDESPLFGCIASVVCRRLLLSLNEKESMHYGLVSDTHRYMRGARNNNGAIGLRNPLRAIIDAIADGDAEIKSSVSKLTVDAKAMARLVREGVPRQ